LSRPAQQAFHILLRVGLVGVRAAFLDDFLRTRRAQALRQGRAGAKDIIRAAEHAVAGRCALARVKRGARSELLLREKAAFVRLRKLRVRIAGSTETFRRVGFIGLAHAARLYIRGEDRGAKAFLLKMGPHADRILRDIHE
ncbi:MAG: hypothetical protein ACK55I_41975, partial [bacterium]